MLSKMMLMTALAAATLFLGSLMMEWEQARWAAALPEKAEEAIRARQIAQAGLDAAMGQLVRQYDTWRTGYPTVAYQGGAFEVVVRGTAAGPLLVATEGRFQTATHRKEMTLARLSTMPGALLVAAEAIDARTSDGALISGQDTRPPSSLGKAAVQVGNGGGPAVHSVYVSSQEVRNAFETARALDAERPLLLRGLGRDGDEGTDGTLGLDLETLWQEALPYVDHAYAGQPTFEDAAFGAPDTPVFVHLQGGATFAGHTRGYGLLLAEGHLVLHEDFVWEGIILVRGSGDLRIRQADQARIFGALALLHTPATPDTSGLSLALTDAAALHYSTEAIGKLAARLPSVRRRAWVVRFDYREEGW